jgi:predicted GNAT family N-acyltransferase
MEGLEIRVIRNVDELKAVFKIREEVFIRGQGVQRSIEMDEYDEQAEHVIVLKDGKPIGCARVRPVNGMAKLERIAILEEHRGKHYGKELVKFLIDHCTSKGIDGVFMNSQYYVRDYYRQFGFREEGAPFMEAGIKHIRMVLRSKEGAFQDSN